MSGQSYEHRRQWVEDRLLFLTTVFTIDVCSYAVMSNHTHMVLHVDAEKARNLPQKAVIERWQKLHTSTLLAQQFTDKHANPLTELELLTLKDTIAIYRKRLFDISWFMRELNEFIARRANTEDDCTGRFWEGRFKSQALLDEHALAACMVYVDLNPVRAKMAATPATSDHTSIKRRINDAEQGHQPRALMPFVGNPKKTPPKGLMFSVQDYIQFVEATSKTLDPSKRSAIHIETNSILSRLGLCEEQWQILSCSFETTFCVAAGTVDSLKKYKSHTKRKRMPNVRLRL